MTNEIQKQYGVIARVDDVPVSELAGYFVKSGFFKDARDVAQAIVKIQAGRELGFPPVTSMTGIYIVEGKVMVGAQMIGACAIKHGYRYRTVEHTNEACEVEIVKDGTVLGTARFTMAEARAAGLANKSNWKNYGRQMLLWRALAQAVRSFAPDALGGMPVYDPDEVESLPTKRVENLTPPGTEPAADETPEPPVDEEAIKAWGEDLQAKAMAARFAPDEFDWCLGQIMAKFGATNASALTPDQRKKITDRMDADGWKLTREAWKAKAQ